MGERALKGGLIAHVETAVRHRLVVDEGFQLKRRRAFPRGFQGFPKGQGPLKGNLIVLRLIHHNERVFQGFHEAISNAGFERPV